MPELIKNFGDTEIKEAIRDAETGINQYKVIMKQFPDTIVSQNKQFQEIYIDFYEMQRFCSDEFIVTYFNFLEKSKNSDPKPTFINTLRYFYNNPQNHGKLEFSFVSKLLATLDDKLPVWDSNVFICFGLKNPGNWKPTERRIEEALEIYNDLKKWYEIFLESEKSCNWEGYFDEIHLDSNITTTRKITSVKKIDFILWKLGARIKRENN